MTIEAGQRIRNYRVIEQIGRGGAAFVYLAENENLGKHVALKMMKEPLATDPEWVGRFKDEARFAAALNHANIVSIYDLFDWEGSWVIIMEYMRLGSAKALVRALSLEQIITALGMVLEGLRTVEPAGIVHRDLKPENLLRTDQGTLKITDFGIAKSLSTEDLHRTKRGEAPGTVLYMAPELLTADGGGPSPRSDLYSVGVIAYQLIRGEPPFARARDAYEVAIRKTQMQAMKLELFNEEELGMKLDIGIAQWVDRLLDRNPDNRPPDAETALAALRGHADRVFGPGWEDHGHLPVEDAPPQRPEPDLDMSSGFVGIREQRSIAGRLGAKHLSGKPRLWRLGLASLVWSLPVPALLAMLGYILDIAWIYFVAGAVLLTLTLLRFFDRRFAYRVRGNLRSPDREGHYSSRVKEPTW